MLEKKFLFHGNQAIIFNNGTIPRNASELINSGVFRQVLKTYLVHLKKNDSSLLKVFPANVTKDHDRFEAVHKLLRELSFKKKDDVIKDFPQFEPFFGDIYLMDQWVENLYNFWRHYERFFVFCRGGDFDASGDERPYRTFNETVESLAHVVRSVYRDIRENITGDHPRVYRQVAAGIQMGLIARRNGWICPERFHSIKKIPMIRQMYMSPPLIFDPPMNKRDGFFQKVSENPLAGFIFKEGEWLCYPAKVFDTVILAFFNIEFMGMGTSLANLFEIACDEDLKKPPDAIYAYGVPKKILEKFGNPPTVFYDDEENGLLVGAVPEGDEFGYFGYLKKDDTHASQFGFDEKGQVAGAWRHGADQYEER